MGAWGTSNFSNDSALDWIVEFNVQPGVRSLNKALKEYIETGGCCEEALGAAEIVAAWNGYPAPDLPESARSWLSRQKKGPTSTVSSLAVQAVEKILAASELQSRWLESESYAEWRNVQEELVKRLHSEFRPLEKTNEKKPKAAPKAARVGVAVAAATKYWNFRDQPVPDLTGVHRFEIELGQDYTESELEQIAKLAETRPEITVQLSDVQRVRGFRLRDNLITPFRATRSLRLILDTLDTLTHFSSFKNLRKLTIVDSKRISDWASLSGLSSLRVLCLGSLRSLKNLDDVASLPNLRMLQLQNLPNLENLEALTRFSTLEALILGELKEGLQLPRLSGLEKLQYLEIYLRQQTDLQAISELPRLRDLSLCWPPDSIDDEAYRCLKNHPTLKHVNVTGIDWKPKQNKINALLGTTPLDVNKWPDFTLDT